LFFEIVLCDYVAARSEQNCCSFTEVLNDMSDSLLAPGSHSPAKQSEASEALQQQVEWLHQQRILAAGQRADASKRRQAYLAEVCELVSKAAEVESPHTGSSPVDSSNPSSPDFRAFSADDSPLTNHRSRRLNKLERDHLALKQRVLGIKHVRPSPCLNVHEREKVFSAAVQDEFVRLEQSELFKSRMAEAHEANLRAADEICRVGVKDSNMLRARVKDMEANFWT
jgi:hypothetical protein